MENHQLFPFERNRYYVGKLLTSADFQTEQVYFNDKRRFVNGLMYGAGVVCGLSVYSLDDLTVMVESGAALDGLGREVVLESSVVKKLSAIEGFEALASDRATLCLRYREEPVHPVYTVNRQEQNEEYECNQIREGWQLFLADTETLERKSEPETEFLNEASLYSDSDYSAEAAFPSAVSCGGSVKLTVSVTKRSSAPKSFSFLGVLQMPAFSAPGGEHELTVKIGEIELAEGESFRCEYWLTAQAQEAEETVILTKPDSVTVTVGGEEKAPGDRFALKTSVSAEPAADLIAREVGRVSLEAHEAAAPPDFVPLAELTLELSQNAYIIEKITEKGVKKYIRTAAAEALRRRYASYFGGWGAPNSAARPADDSAPADERPAPLRDTVFATGTCEIPLGDKALRGEVVYSDETMHGLGPGDVYVDVGFEYLAQDPRLSSTARSTIYGDAELFSPDAPPVPCVKTAVRVMNDRGSFVVAAKLLKDSPYVVLLVRWVAFRIPSETDRTQLQRIAGKSISAVSPTMLLAARETCFVNVRFHNMEPCGLVYELTEKNSGAITQDGVYTAPAREGVYEIRISCADMPLVNTYAYAIVKKRDGDSEEEKP